MRRMDRAQDRAFCLELMDRCTHGVMALSTGEDTPYCLPLSFVRVDNALYFHCAKEGRKIDLLRKNPQVCITFVGSDVPTFVAPAMYTSYFQSAIVTGSAHEVTDPTEKTSALRALCEKLTPHDLGEGFDRAIEKSLNITAVWRVDMEDVSGKAKKMK